MKGDRVGYFYVKINPYKNYLRYEKKNLIRQKKLSAVYMKHCEYKRNTQYKNVS